MLNENIQLDRFVGDIPVQRPDGAGANLFDSIRNRVSLSFGINGVFDRIAHRRGHQ